MALTCLIQFFKLNKTIRNINQFLQGLKNEPVLKIISSPVQIPCSFQVFKLKDVTEKIPALEVINDYSDQIFIQARDVIKKAPRKKILVINPPKGVIKVIFKDTGWRKLGYAHDLPKGVRLKRGYKTYYHKPSEALVYVARHLAVGA